MHRAWLLALVACAAPKSDSRYAQPGGDNRDDDVVCHEVTDTGSMFSHTECTPRQTIDEQRNDARRFLDKPRAYAPPRPPPTKMGN
jgi:hypothetical protein